MMGFLTFMMLLVLGALVLVGGLQWISGRQGDGLPRMDAERLDRIESALSSLESRVDDLQDQQRFLERLLAERPEPSALESGDDDGEEAASDAATPDPTPDDVDSILFDTGKGEERDDR